jgi:hypothetical protein
MTQLHNYLHIRFDGRSFDLPLAQLGLADELSEQDVRAAAARFLEVGFDRLDDYVVEQHKTGNMTLRPEAIYG